MEDQIRLHSVLSSRDYAAFCRYVSVLVFPYNSKVEQRQRLQKSLLNLAPLQVEQGFLEQYELARVGQQFQKAVAIITSEKEPDCHVIEQIILWGAVDEALRRIKDINGMIKFPKETVSCGEAQEIFCTCFDLEREITPLGIALSVEGASYDTRPYISPQMVQGLLDAGADACLAWKEKRSGARYCGSENDKVLPLTRAVDAEYTSPAVVCMLIQHGARPCNIKQETKMLDRGLLLEPNHFLAKLGFPAGIPEHLQRDVLMFLWVAKNSKPRLPKDLYCLLIRHITRVTHETVFPIPLFSERERWFREFKKKKPEKGKK